MIAVVGAGSLGMRHIENLRFREDLNRIIVVDPDPRTHDRIIASCDEKPGTANVTIYGDLSDRIFDTPLLGAIISTPTYLHAESALPFLERDIPVLIEKPLAHTVADADKLAPYHEKIKVGYTLRSYQPMQVARQCLEAIGKPIFIEAMVGQYLPDWHPGSDYRHWYMAKSQLGGGAALDLSHELDLVQYLMDSPVKNAYGDSWQIHPNLDIQADDLTIIYGNLTNGTPFLVRTDIIDRYYNRRLRIIGTEGTINWDFKDQAVQVNSDTYHYAEVRNYQFQEEEKNFINWVQGKDPGNLASYESAYHTMDVTLAVRAWGCWTPNRQ